ncbi:hypothetical protein QBC42DRAFT_300627 [Cladorrhinum samala]|uniref:Secreted protein n=1 Tax=Cladorrhinum samala TaxID=585594 RepID=A0AAV9HB90_9PEZI|nr:hypothetical protein QBC42DRAFT_300627 [Cladorrhinum samala]
MSAILWTTTLTATATATPEWLGCCGRTRRAGHVRRETLLSSVSRLAAVDATNQETASYHLEDTWWTAPHMRPEGSCRATKMKMETSTRSRLLGATYESPAHLHLNRSQYRSPISAFNAGLGI